MITLYGISNCDTIKKARKWLADHEFAYAFHDYRRDGCPAALVSRFLDHFSLDELINRRGTTWRNLPEARRATLNDKTAPELLSDQPAMIKRPIIHYGDRWMIGFKPDTYDNLFKKAGS